MSPEALALYNQFLSFKEAECLLNKIDNSPNPRDRNYKQQLRGEIFESFARRALVKSLSREDVLLTPKETTEVYCRLYQNIRPDRLDDLNTGLMHVPFPDGLVLHPSDRYWRITGLAEYKFSSKPEEIGRQSKHYVNQYRISSSLGTNRWQSRDRLGTIIHDINPNIPAFPVMLDHNYLVWYVLPGDVSSSSVPSHPKIRVHQVNFARSSFIQFVDLLVDETLAPPTEVPFYTSYARLT